MLLNEMTETVIGAAIDVHRELGPGLLESTYEGCLEFELTGRGVRVERQKPLLVVYKSFRIDCGYRVDLLVENQVIVEMKSVEQLERIHEAQVHTYLKLTGCQVGLLINFNETLLKNGIRGLVNRLPE